MWRTHFIVGALVAVLAWQAVPLGNSAAYAKHGWDGKRRVSYQDQNDLFYNYYTYPGPLPGPGAQLYVSPQPVPPFVGQTYVTYQPFMPHEYLYRHERSYYTYNYGAGWTRTNVRYGTFGGRLNNFCLDMRWPATVNIGALNNYFYHPGVNCN
jgi:hypothetical protein